MRAKNKLTAKAIAEIADPGLYEDGEGLYLEVAEGPGGMAGAKSWVFIHEWRGEIGDYPTLSMSDVRAKRDKALTQLAAGRLPYFGPLNDRTIKHGNATFGAIARQLHGDIEPSFRNRRHGKQWWTSLKTYAKPIWDMPVDEVDTDAVLKCLRPIWGRIPETADRVRGRIERVLDVARVKGLRGPGENPAHWKGHLALILPEKRKSTRGHHPAMSYDQVPAFMAKLRVRRGMGARMLELTILTAGRSGEIIRARRREVDLGNALWVIPGERMKAGLEHRVPLVGRALEIMREACEGKAPDDFLFPGWKPGRPKSNMTMDMLLRRMLEVKVTVHGFRSSFRDWAGDTTEFAEEIVEQALAHLVGNAVRRAYRRGFALEKRRELMTEWDSWCASEVLKLAVEMAFGNARKPRRS